MYTATLGYHKQNMPRKERNWNHVKYPGKMRKGRKWVEDKTRNKEQEQQVETVMVDINPTIPIINENLQSTCTN